MDYSKPTLLIVSGPNGAGKSTHIKSMLPGGFTDAVPFDRDKTRMAFEDMLAAEGGIANGQQESALTMMEQLLLQKIQEAISAKNILFLKHPCHILITGNILTASATGYTKCS